VSVLRARTAVAAVLLVGLLTYPVVVLARSAPEFPSAEDCVAPATSDGSIELVFGRFTSATTANAAAARVHAAGLHPSVALDDCGRLVVATTGYTKLAAARAAAARAAKAGLAGQPEVAPPS
jgi:hypothetical protein